MRTKLKKYCASILSTGKYTVATIGLYGDLHFVGNVRSFDTFDEANQVAKDISRGKYGYVPGEYVNMR